MADQFVNSRFLWRLVEIVNLALEGVKWIKPSVFSDERGFFRETYRADLCEKWGIKSSFVQDNHSFSKKGVLRGLHFQKNPGQAKWVSVIEGVIFDVVVDIRLQSATFGQWLSVTLSAENGECLFVPVGFAHGFCVLSEGAHVIYKVTEFYNPAEEGGICFNDPDLNIAWPMSEPILSERDRKHPRFRESMGVPLCSR